MLQDTYVEDLARIDLSISRPCTSLLHPLKKTRGKTREELEFETAPGDKTHASILLVELFPVWLLRPGSNRQLTFLFGLPPPLFPPRWRKKQCRLRAVRRAPPSNQAAHQVRSLRLFRWPLAARLFESELQLFAPAFCCCYWCGYGGLHALIRRRCR